jgi:hypothetical protein
VSEKIKRERVCVETIFICVCYLHLVNSKKKAGWKEVYVLRIRKRYAVRIHVHYTQNVTEHTHAHVNSTSCINRII